MNDRWHGCFIWSWIVVARHSVHANLLYESQVRRALIAHFNHVFYIEWRQFFPFQDGFIIHNFLITSLSQRVRILWEVRFLSEKEVYDKEIKLRHFVNELDNVLDFSLLFLNVIEVNLLTILKIWSDPLHHIEQWLKGLVLNNFSDWRKIETFILDLIHRKSRWRVLTLASSWWWRAESTSWGSNRPSSLFVRVKPSSSSWPVTPLSWGESTKEWWSVYVTLQNVGGTQ